MSELGASRAVFKAPEPAVLTDARKFVWHYIRQQRMAFGLLVLTVVSAASCGVAVQYMMKLLVDAMAHQPPAAGQVWWVFGGFFLLVGTESLLWRSSGWLGCRTTLRAGVQVRLDLFEYLHNQPMRYFAENTAGALGQRITGTAGNFGAMSNTAVWRISPPLVDFIGALIIFTTIDWRIAVALSGSVAAITFGLIRFGRRGHALHGRYSGFAATVGGALIDIISNMWAVKAFTARAREYARLQTQFSDEYTAQRASWMHLEKIRVLYDGALLLVAGGTVAWGVYLWTMHRITPGDVVVISGLTFRILHGSRDMALALVEIVQQFGYVENTLQVIGETPKLVDPPGAPHLMPTTGSIEFRNVSFAYEVRRPCLRNINLRIPAGQKVGIVGPSGAGKSTFVQLLQRLYDVGTGEILIDGQSIATVTQDSLRAALSVVPQEILLFHRTVAENIRFGRPEASPEDVVAAARAAHCEAFVASLPQGYDTVVGERGAKLSGGQRQRVGIARALLKQSPILILDEATSALDTDSEQEILRNLADRYPDRTIVAVAHRLSTLATFDRVLVMADGQIVEDGAPAALRANGGMFDQMWRRQVHGMLSTAA